MRNFIYSNGELNLSKGGTVGYLSHLFISMQRFNLLDTEKGIKNCFYFNKNLKEFCEGKDDGLHSLAHNMYDKSQNLDNYYAYMNLFTNFNDDIKAEINIGKFTSFHANGIYNFFPLYNLFKERYEAKNIIKILTTHNPYKPWLEFKDQLEQKGTYKNIKDKTTWATLNDYRDEFAFKMADAFIFPSENSLDGYYETIPNFSKIIEGKPICFVPTGIVKNDKIDNTTLDIRAQFNIPQNVKILLYVGRPVKVRGIDLLIETIKRFQNRKDIVFIVVGGQISLNLPNCIEVSHTDNVDSFYKIADALIAPNRGSLFDLTMVEALSYGLPIIAASVGGYNWLKQVNAACFLFEKENVQDMCRVIESFSKIDRDSYINMLSKNKEIFTNYLRPDLFAKNYNKALDDIYDQFPYLNKNRVVSYVRMVASENDNLQKNNNSKKKDKLDNKFLSMGSIRETQVVVNNGTKIDQQYKESSNLTKIFVLLLLDRKRLKYNFYKKKRNILLRLLIKLIPN